MLSNSYIFPTTISDLVKELKKDKSMIIAGCTDMYLGIESGDIEIPKTFIDITRLTELREIKNHDDYIQIGSAVTHTELMESKTIKENFMSLSEAASYIGSPQIRNIGTIGGNIVNAAPAADLLPPLVSLNAKAEVMNANSEKKLLPIRELYVDIKTSLIDSRKEVLLNIKIDKPKLKYGVAFTRFSKRASLSLPIINVAVFLTIKNTIISEIEIVAAPTGPHPINLNKTEDYLLNGEINDDILEEAMTISQKELSMRSSLLRGKNEFREKIGGVLVKRAVKIAYNRALG